MGKIVGYKEDESGEIIIPVVDESLPNPIPMVGIFFFVDDDILMDAVPVEDGEPYGDAVQHGGHYEFWERIAPKTLAERKFKARAYDAYPRGRVIFFPKKKKYVLYGDHCISTDEYGLVAEQFGLNGIFDEGMEIGIEHDLHYKCARCNLHFLE